MKIIGILMGVGKGLKKTIFRADLGPTGSYVGGPPTQTTKKKKKKKAQN